MLFECCLSKVLLQLYRRNAMKTLRYVKFFLMRTVTVLVFLSLHFEGFSVILTGLWSSVEFTEMYCTDDIRADVLTEHICVI